VTIYERTDVDERDRLLAQLLQDHPPIQRLEEIVGPEPMPEDRDEVDAFLQARSRWQQAYPMPEEAR
jgi:hypothetical protein